MFGFNSNNTSTSSFTLINFDANLLGSYFNARTVTRTVSAIQNAPTRIERGPAVITPWDALAGSDRTLAAKYNALRGKTNFIDLNTDNVRQTRDKDERALFALYQALNNLKTVADYAKEESTPTAILAKLSDQFRGGLSEVQDYIRAAELDKLSLMFGKKEPRLQSDVSLGKNNYDIIGSALSVSSKTQVIPGLSGTEVFTVNLNTGTVNDDITIDLSQITEPITLSSLSSYINQQIISLTKLDTEGNEVSKYDSRFGVKEVSTGKFALMVDGISSEKVTLSAQITEPALYVTGSYKAVGSDSVETATLTKLRNLAAADTTTEFNTQIAGTNLNNFIPPSTDEDGETITAPAELFETKATASVVDSQGNVYVVGTTKGDFGTQINTSQNQDVFLSKQDAAGNVLWSRLLGASDEAEAFDLVIDGNDNVVIAGQVNGELVTSDTFSGLDSFISKFDSAGEELWTYQQDTIAKDQANSLAIDANGDVIVTGSISGRLDSTTTAGGGSDIYVTRLGGADGVIADLTQIGGTGSEYGEAVTIASDGNILIASREDGRAIIRKLDATDLTNELATYDLGNLAGGKIADIAVDDSGQVFITGTSYNGSLSGGATTNAHSGSADGFLTKLTDNGASLTANWTHYLGSSGNDRLEGLTVHNGAVYLAGKTDGTLPGETKFGTTDGFAAKIDATTGTADWLRQFGGSTGYKGSSSLAFSATGSSVLTKLGLPTGLYNNRQTHDIDTQTSARVGDYFYISVNGGRQRKITLEAGDTFADLATKVQRASFRYVKAVQIIGENGPELKIESQAGATIDISAGKGAQDALIKLGMEPTKILPSDKVYAIGEETLGTDPENLGGVFGLGLLSGFSLRTKKEAEYVSGQVAAALETIERAYRSLTYDPVKADILKQAKIKKGTVPPHLLSQLNNYQDGLNRISALTGNYSGSLFI
ncbi:SBBP repeat-containing protein [Paremcibacter congregatus]|uniref:SBBP repeat-containing protein n=1 Tax=Paremcibacter congregatus TaxID=2043170 RepID=UPI0030ED440F|tara:strand:+ start:9940 stop:12759 length:2820 start_codon:yes stop_codon:yes gene_type:complete